MYVASVVEREINSVTDNPTIFTEDDLIISGGNFHGQPLALVLDFLSIALAELGSISERRTYRLISGDRGHIPEFLVANPGLNSGFMIPQYAAAAIVSKTNNYVLRVLWIPSLRLTNRKTTSVWEATQQQRQFRWQKM